MSKKTDANHRKKTSPDLDNAAVLHTVGKFSRLHSRLMLDSLCEKLRSIMNNFQQHSEFGTQSCENCDTTL